MNSKVLKILNISAFLQQQRFMLPVVFLFYLYNGLTLADFIAFQGVHYLVIFLASIPAGYIGDVFKKKHILIFAYFLFIMRIVLWLFASGFFIILLGEILYSLSKSFYKVADGYIYEYLEQNNADNKMIQCYGKYNFYVSMATAVSAVIGAVLYKGFGFKTILTIELIIHIIAIVLLFLLPEVNNGKIKSVIKNSKMTFFNHVKNIFDTLKNIVTDKRINSYIIMTSILMGATSLYVSLFQPTMEEAFVPAVLFGVLYFFNNVLRAVSALFTYKVFDKSKAKKFAICVYISFCVSFIILFMAQQILNPVFCFSALVLICIAIGLGMMFYVIAGGIAQEVVSSNARATVSSIQNMCSCACSFTILFAYRKLIEIIPKENVLIIFLMLFIPVIYIVKKIGQSKIEA